jgi:hypothetical protein
LREQLIFRLINDKHLVRDALSIFDRE